MYFQHKLFLIQYGKLEDFEGEGQKEVPEEFYEIFMKILFGVKALDAEKLIYTKVASSDFDHALVLSDQHTV